LGSEARLRYGDHTEPLALARGETRNWRPAGGCAGS